MFKFFTNQNRRRDMLRESNDTQHNNLSAEQNENQEIRRTTQSIDYDRIDLQLKQISADERLEQLNHQKRLNNLEVQRQQESLRQQQLSYDENLSRKQEINGNLSLNNQNTESARSVRLIDNNTANSFANLNNIDNDSTKDKIENAILTLNSVLASLTADNVGDNQNKK